MIIYIDCTSTIRTGLKTGIQRIVRQFIYNSESLFKKRGFDVVPIYFDDNTNKFHYYYDAVSVYDKNKPEKSEIVFRKGCFYFCPDAFWSFEMFSRFKTIIKNQLTLIVFIYDLIPITCPSYYSAHDRLLFEKSINEVISYADLVLFCSSFELQNYQSLHNLKKGNPAQTQKLIPITSLMERSRDLDTSSAIDFTGEYLLSVGTIEHRKGYIELIREMNIVWQKNNKINLVIVGKPGVKFFEIEEIIREINNSKEKIFIITNCSDDQLIYLYENARAVILPSKVEGFGLPLVEALKFNGCVFANNLPIFKEISGDFPTYFNLDEYGDLANKINKFINGDEIIFYDKKGRLFTWSDTIDKICDELSDI